MTCKPNNANSINKYGTRIVIASTFQVVKSLSIFPISHPLFRISSKNKNIVIIYWIPNDRAGDEPHFSVLPFLRDEPRQHKKVVQASQIPTKPQYLPFQCNLTFTQKTQTNVNGERKRNMRSWKKNVKISIWNTILPSHPSLQINKKKKF